MDCAVVVGTTTIPDSEQISSHTLCNLFLYTLEQHYLIYIYFGFIFYVDAKIAYIARRKLKVSVLVLLSSSTAHLYYIYGVIRTRCI